jgi:aspartate-semialdehyde dehydrogenase
MSQPSAQSDPAPRIAVVGAPTPEGSSLREALAERGVPGSRVDLYGTTGGEVVLSEYAGEARMIQEPRLEELAEHALIFLCERGELAEKLFRQAPDAVIIDLHDTLPPDSRPRCIPLAPQEPPVRDDGRFAVAHPIALVLAEVLQPLDQAFGVREVSAVVMRPAADFGEPGVEELREQTVRLLNFAELPVETFGRQLAFNVLPVVDPAEERRIQREVGELLSWAEPRLTVALVTAPMFHGHGLQLRVCLDAEAGGEAIDGKLGEAGLAAGAETAPSPLDVIGEVRTRIAAAREDGMGGFWLSGAAGETASRGAEEAVRLAGTLFDL